MIRQIAFISTLLLLSFLSAQVNDTEAEKGDRSVSIEESREQADDSKQDMQLFKDGNIRRRVLEDNSDLKRGSSNSFLGGNTLGALSRYGPGAMATGLLGYFKLTPDLSTSSMSVGYYSSGSESGYIASYNYRIGYDIGKFGDLRIDLTASQIGSSRYNDNFMLTPSLRWNYRGENMNLMLHIDTPPIVNKQSQER